MQANMCLSFPLLLTKMVDVYIFFCTSYLEDYDMSVHKKLPSFLFLLLNIPFYGLAII